jgi:hypothetical protein
LFLVIIIATGHDSDPSGPSLLPLLATFSAFLSAFASCFGWCCPTAIEGRFHITQNEDNLDRLLTRSMLGGDIKQLHGGVWLIPTEFMHQGLASCASPECRDDMGVRYPWELMTLLGKVPDVTLEGFTQFLPVTPLVFSATTNNMVSKIV